MDRLFDDEAELAKWSTYSKRFGVELNFDGSVDPFVLEMCKRAHARKVVPSETPSLDYLFARMKVAEKSKIMLKADVARKYKKRKFKRYLSLEKLEWKFISECCRQPPNAASIKKASRELQRLTESELGIGRLTLNELGRTRQQTENARIAHYNKTEMALPKNNDKREKE